MTPEEIKAFAAEVKAGKFSDEKLRLLINLASSTSLQSFGTAAGIPSFYNEIKNYIYSCDWCGQFSWRANYQIDVEYGYGVVRVCQRCGPATFCETCSIFYTKPQAIKHKHPDPPPGCVDPHSRKNPPGTHSPDGLILSYNAKIEPLLFAMTSYVGQKQNDKIPCYGIELEVERKPEFPEDLHSKIIGTFPDKYIMLKRDGSLGDGGMGENWTGAKGFELVTAPCTFEFVKETNHWKQFFATFNDYLEHDPGTTGLHIHIGTNALTPLDISKYWKFVNAQENRKFLSWVADRELIPTVKSNEHGNYAMLRPHEKMTRFLQRSHEAICPMNPYNNGKNWITYDKYYNDDWGNPIIVEVRMPSKNRNICKCRMMRFPYHRHEAFNLNTGLPTVELRIFKGKMDQAFFFSCLEFTDSMVTFVKNVSKEDMLWDVYLNWFNKDMRRLYPNFSERVKNANKANIDFYVKDKVDYNKPSAKLNVTGTPIDPDFQFLINNAFDNMTIAQQPTYYNHATTHTTVIPIDNLVEPIDYAPENEDELDEAIF